MFDAVPRKGRPRRAAVIGAVFRRARGSTQIGKPGRRVLRCHRRIGVERAAKERRPRRSRSPGDGRVQFDSYLPADRRTRASPRRASGSERKGHGRQVVRPDCPVRFGRPTRRNYRRRARLRVRCSSVSCRNAGSVLRRRDARSCSKRVVRGRYRARQSIVGSLDY